MRIEHLPHIGVDYEAGIDGQKVAIVAYSHWGDAEHDSEEFTRQCVNRVISGEWNISAYAAIRNYFGFERHADFWPRVMFFNYVPTTIGTGDERYNFATEEEIVLAKERFDRLCKEHRPAKAFVFTSKVDHALPALNYHPFLPGIDWLWRSDQTIPDVGTRIFRMRHPQGANGQVMREAVSAALSEPSNDKRG